MINYGLIIIVVMNEILNQNISVQSIDLIT